MAPERFKFREDVLRAAASRTRRRFATTLVATTAIVTGAWAMALRPQGAGWGTLAFSLALLAGLAALSLRRRMRRLHERWASFEIALEDGALSRQVSGFAPVRIARAEIEAIAERPEGLVVRGRGGAAVLVPRELDGYARVRDALTAWAPRPSAAGPLV